MLPAARGTGEIKSLFDHLYHLFDRNNDNLISSTDFVDTLRGLEAESLLRLRVKEHYGFRPKKLCRDVRHLFKLKTTATTANENETTKEPEEVGRGFKVYIEDPHATN